MKHLVGIFLAILILCSCERKISKSALSGADVDTVAIIDTVDTIIVDTVEIDTLPPRRYFHDSISALKFVKSEEYRNSYKGSIIPQMIKDYFPYAQKLLNSKYQRFIVVDKYSMRVMLFDRMGRLERAYKMACARNYGTKHEKGDERTPEGFFSVENIYDSTDWLFVDDNGKKSDIKGQFGPRFIRLRIPGTSQIGIHGTCSPRSIGWRCSHGCIRITNEQIMELVELVEPGMPVIVNPGRRDTKTNLEEGFDVPWISVAPDTARYRKPKFTPKPPVDTVVADSVLVVPIVVDTMPVIEMNIDTVKPEIIIEL
jgi:hypothetical protein